MKRISKLISIVIISAVLTSCYTSYSHGSDRSYSIYKGGYWGGWSRSVATELLYQKASYENGKILYSIVEHASYKHPSNFDFKISLLDDKDVIKSNGWYEYNGTIICSSSIEESDNMIENYQTKDLRSHLVNKEYYSFSAIIRSNKKISDVIKKGHGTINVYYSGVGRAWSF